MTKFLEYLSEPQRFTDWSYVVAKEAMTKEEFAKEMDTDVENIKENFVHFHFWFDDDSWEKVNCWWLWYKHLKNSKPVWYFNL